MRVWSTSLFLAIQGIIARNWAPTTSIWCSAVRRRRAVCWDRLLFSAKESVYKAWHPVAGSWLGFEDVEVELAPAAGTFVATIGAPGPLPRLAGRVAATPPHVLTAIHLAG